MSRTKPEDVKILQISAVYNAYVEKDFIYGLGNDGKVYFWSRIREAWIEEKE
jgi:hypothetical protein